MNSMQIQQVVEVKEEVIKISEVEDGDVSG
jgi:hypothetical protein